MEEAASESSYSGESNDDDPPVNTIVGNIIAHNNNQSSLTISDRPSTFMFNTRNRNGTESSSRNNYEGSFNQFFSQRRVHSHSTDNVINITIPNNNERHTQNHSILNYFENSYQNTIGNYSNPLEIPSPTQINNTLYPFLPIEELNFSSFTNNHNRIRNHLSSSVPRRTQSTETNDLNLVRNDYVPSINLVSSSNSNSTSSSYSEPSTISLIDDRANINLNNENEFNNNIRQPFTLLGRRRERIFPTVQRREASRSLNTYGILNQREETSERNVLYDFGRSSRNPRNRNIVLDDSISNSELALNNDYGMDDQLIDLVDFRNYPLNIDYSKLNDTISYANEIYKDYGLFGLALYSLTSKAKFPIPSLIPTMDSWLNYFFKHYFNIVITSNYNRRAYRMSFEEEVKKEKKFNYFEVEDYYSFLPKIEVIKEIVLEKKYSIKDCVAIKIVIDIWESYYNYSKNKTTMLSFYENILEIYNKFSNEDISMIYMKLSDKGVLKTLVNHKKIRLFNSKAEYISHYSSLKSNFKELNLGLEWTKFIC